MTAEVVSTIKQMTEIARSCGKKVYVKAEGISGILGVFEVYPGGRTIFWSSDKGRIFERKLSEALQDVVFRVNGGTRR